MNRFMEWRSFETSLKTEARSCSQTAVNYLTSIFDGIGKLQTRNGARSRWMRVPAND
jgi:hypothetical protein